MSLTDAEREIAARNFGRTYDWLHKDMPISAPHLTDEEVARRVRMLMRDTLTHEAICCMARDRIMCLLKEKEQLARAALRVSKACERAIEQAANIDILDVRAVQEQLTGLTALAATQLHIATDGARSCRVCGCTEDNACVDDERGACWWVDADLCSHCEDKSNA